MQLNVFTWIREGVRQAVILGVSDAVETLGEPNANGQASLREQLHEALTLPEPEPAAAARRSTRSRKRISRAAEIEVE